MNHLFDDSRVTLHLPLLYNQSFSTPWASFAHFIFREQEESPRVRVYLWFSREERILLKFSIFFTPSKFVSEKKVFQVWKHKLLHNFQTQGILSSNLKLFLSSNPMRHTFSSQIVKKKFQLNLMKYISESNETHLFMI